MLLHSLFRFGVAFVGVDVCFDLCDLKVRLRSYLVESVFVECHPLVRGMSSEDLSGSVVARGE